MKKLLGILVLVLLLGVIVIFIDDPYEGMDRRMPKETKTESTK